MTARLCPCVPSTTEGRCIRRGDTSIHDRGYTLFAAATRLATRCGRAVEPVVFCPPIATFADCVTATEKNLANGLALSIECDANPSAARLKLEALLGPATVVVASGGEWVNPMTGELEDKLHMHWRLNEPTRDPAEHASLKLARTLATRLVGGDATNKPIVHPIRWPGSWHRKAAPRLAWIVALTEHEIDLQDALERLEETAGAVGLATIAPAPGGDPKGEERATAELIRTVLTAEDYHAPLAALAMRLLKAEMPDAQVKHHLRGIMLAVPDEARDAKGGTTFPGRWQARYDEIPRAVQTARQKLGPTAANEATADTSSVGVWDRLDIASYRLDLISSGDPPPQRFLLAPLMPRGVVGLIFGPGGVGKSLVALELCMVVSGWRPPGQAVRPLGGAVEADAIGASVFVTLEDSKEELHRRTAALDPGGRRAELPCYVIPAIELPDFDPALVRTEGRTAALTALATNGLDLLLTNVALAAGVPVRLLVLDPAGDFINADENAAENVKPLMRCLRAIAARHDCTIILLGHSAKGMDADTLSMRGSGAWVANSRFAYALYRPTKEEAKGQSPRLGVSKNALLAGTLVKANHACAPVGVRQWFRRDDVTGRLIDITPAADRDPRENAAVLLDLLVAACGECAAAGMPFTVTGNAGLYQARADLPKELTSLSRSRLEELGNAALKSGRLVKARSTKGHAAPRFLDMPDGPLARGTEIKWVHGSRAEALARFRAAGASVAI